MSQIGRDRRRSAAPPEPCPLRPDSSAADAVASGFGGLPDPARRARLTSRARRGRSAAARSPCGY